jgi:hypothetical protein
VLLVWRDVRRVLLVAQAEAYATKQQGRRPEASGTKGKRKDEKKS